MLMIGKIAEEIYEKSIQLKKYDAKKLFFKMNRTKLMHELNDIEVLIETILNSLYNNSAFSVEYYKLAVFMQKVLFKCVCILLSKQKDYREIVRRHIWGFHNLPRAFFSSENKMKISPDDAMNYYKSYVK